MARRNRWKRKSKAEATLELMRKIIRLRLRPAVILAALICLLEP